MKARNLPRSVLARLAGKIPTAIERRDAGMAVAAAAQEEKAPSWHEQALAAIKAVALGQATVHVDDVAAAAEGKLPAPSHPNAWGVVWRSAMRRGIIEKTSETRPAGVTYKAHAHKHARLYPVYASKIHGAAA